MDKRRALILSLIVQEEINCVSRGEFLAANLCAGCCNFQAMELQYESDIPGMVFLANTMRARLVIKDFWFGGKPSLHETGTDRLCPGCVSLPSSRRIEPLMTEAELLWMRRLVEAGEISRLAQDRIQERDAERSR
jgi:hypothetical protein